MHKEINIIRANNRHIKILLGEEEFIEKERLELPLSAGEQNFLSLSFELLKAKNSNKPIIVLDDPISSFDSIYKNKIIYSIVKSLEGKSRIILTHNTDMISSPIFIKLRVEFKCYEKFRKFSISMIR